MSQMSPKLMELKKMLGQQLLKMMMEEEEETDLDHQVVGESESFSSSLQVMAMFVDVVL